MAVIKLFEQWLNEEVSETISLDAILTSDGPAMLNYMIKGLEEGKYGPNTDYGTYGPKSAEEPSMLRDLNISLMKKDGTGCLTVEEAYSTLMENAEIADADSKIIEKMSEADRAILAKWKADPKKKLYYPLSIIFNFTDNDYDIRKLLKSKKTKAIAVSSETVKEIPVEGENKAGQPTFPVMPITLSKDASTGDIFEVNEWILSEGFKKEIAAQIQPLAQELATLPEPPAKDGKPGIKAFLNSINIVSSCSVAPNGIPQKSPGAEKYRGGISFAQLSQERANSVKNYVFEELKKIGVVIDEVNEPKTVVTINAKGTRGDGTSGDKDWNQVPGANNQEKLANVKKFQMASFKADIVINTKSKDVIVPDVKEIPSEILKVAEGNYKVTISNKKWIFNWNFKINLGSRENKKNWGRTSCPRF